MGLIPPVITVGTAQRNYWCYRITKVGSGLSPFIYPAIWATRLTTDPNAENQLYQVKFAAPPGSGTRQDLRICYGSSGLTCTQNSAQIFYAKPVVESVRMSDGRSIQTTPGIVPTTGANVTIVGRNLACDPSLNTCNVNNKLTFRWQSLEYFTENLATIRIGDPSNVSSNTTAQASERSSSVSFSLFLLPSSPPPPPHPPPPFFLPIQIIAMFTCMYIDQ